jgi:hypothetical protein
MGLTKTEYLNLSRAQKMALLNIEAKLRETRLGGNSLLSYVEKVQHVADDRVFLLVRSDLKRLIEDSAEFASAPGHGAPKDTPVKLPSHPDSWKHRRFGAGNLQLSFSRKAAPLPGDSGKQAFSLDTDIDLEQGVGHIFEWLDNHSCIRQRKQIRP